MNREIFYPGEILTDVELLTVQRHMMAGLGWAIQAVLGTGTSVIGLGCTPTSPASLSVQVGTGAIFTQKNLDDTAYGSLAADTTAAHQIMKQGLNTAVQTLSCPAPTTAGQSIVYLVQAEYQDFDTNSAVLQYFNSASPSTAFTGPGGSGTSQNTTRQGLCSIAVKAGTAATTGTQTAPSADSGYSPLYTVTVAYGATTITSGNIAVASGAPFIPYTLQQLTPGFSGQLVEFTASGTWTVPAGVTQAKVRVWGAGGGSGGTSGINSGSPGGGQGGGYCEKLITGLVAGTAIAVTVGTGGTAGASGAAGGNGGTSSFGTYLSATGGVGGATNPQGLGGTGGGTATGGSLNRTGGAGSQGLPSGIGGSGGAGGGSPFGGAGGASGYGSGAPGVSPGGGAGAPGTVASQAGSAGADGLVVIEW